jgi:3-phenylpropionate/trans-cinnamate dioxygenase ferredoxin component
MEDEVEVATIDSLPAGEARSFKIGRREIAICNVDGEIYALEGMCTHQELPLDGGMAEDGVLTCEWHGARFDVCSGRALALPAVKALRQYETRVDDSGRIFVRVAA